MATKKLLTERISALWAAYGHFFIIEVDPYFAPVVQRPSRRAPFSLSVQISEYTQNNDKVVIWIWD